MGMLYEYSDEELEWMGLRRYDDNEDRDPLFDVDIEKVEDERQNTR